VREECTRIEDTSGPVGARAHQDVVVQVRLTVPIHAVSEGRNVRPVGIIFPIDAVATIAHDHGSILQVLDGVAHRFTVRVNHRTGV
jgi:hypothetical protein